MAKGNPRIKNINNGINTAPELYSGYDVLHHSLRQTIQGTALAPGYYDARVLFVQKNFDPKLEFKYRIMAFIEELDISMQEPEIYTKLTDKDIVGKEKFFYPLDSSIPAPWLGAPILLYMTDPKNRIGFYAGLKENSPNVSHVEGKTNKQIREQQSAAAAFKDK
mgnify:CR=1 FL=1